MTFKEFSQRATEIIKGKKIDLPLISWTYREGFKSIFISIYKLIWRK